MLLSENSYLDDILSQLHYNGMVHGHTHVPICGFAEDFFAESHFLTWCTSIHVLNHLLRLNIPLVILASCNIHGHIPDFVTVVPTGNPLLLFDKCIATIYHNSTKENAIGNNSYIHNSVVLGKNVQIGNRCWLGANVVIGDNSCISDNVIIEANSVVGSFPFSNYLNNEGYERQVWGGVEIEADTHIGSCTTIDRGFTMNTKIGKNCKIGNQVEIAHDVIIGDHCFIAAQVAIAGNVTIGEDCFLWAKSGIINRIHVAPRTTLYATSIITKDTMCNAELCGFPAMDKTLFWRQLVKNKEILL